MRLFLPSFDAAGTERALTEACRIVRPGDCLIVMAPIIVPRRLPVDVDAGMIWAPVCRAERRLFHAREMAERLLPTGVTLRCVRVQARDRVAAIRTGAAHYRADLLLLDVPRGLRGMLALHFGTIAAILRTTPCNVRFVGTMATEEPVSPLPAPITVAPLPMLQVIAINPTLAASGAEERTGERGETRAIQNRPFP